MKLENSDIDFHQNDHSTIVMSNNINLSNIFPTDLRKASDCCAA
jgi:hypothetical protein